MNKKLYELSDKQALLIEECLSHYKDLIGATLIRVGSKKDLSSLFNGIDGVVNLMKKRLPKKAGDIYECK